MEEEVEINNWLVKLINNPKINNWDKKRARKIIKELEEGVYNTKHKGSVVIIIDFQDIKNYVLGTEGGQVLG